MTNVHFFKIFGLFSIPFGGFNDRSIYHDVSKISHFQAIQLELFRLFMIGIKDLNLDPLIITDP